MPKQAYGPQQKFHADSLKMIAVCNSLLEKYIADGYDITLRQLYYRLFANKFLETNSEKEYKNLGSLVNNARLAGLIDWNHIVDRTRHLRGLSHWDNPPQIVRGAASSYRVDRWAEHKHRVEVWVEKDALVGVVGRVASENDVDYFSCRGYTSQSEMWAAAQRLHRHSQEGKTPVIIHLGDHDPSGVDMSRDIFDRLEMFMGGVEFRRVALNMDQIQKYNPPPNPAKVSDSRFVDYVKKFGHESWELDALDPPTLSALIQKEIDKYKEQAPWKAAEDAETSGKSLLTTAAERWPDVAEFFDLDLTTKQIRGKFDEAEKHLNDAKRDVATANEQVASIQKDYVAACDRYNERGKTIAEQVMAIVRAKKDLLEIMQHRNDLEVVVKVHADKIKDLTEENAALKLAAKGRK